MIQAKIYKPFIYKHDGIIKEGSVYNITKFVVALNHGEYRVARHEYKLDLKYHALIRPVSAAEVHSTRTLLSGWFQP